MASQTDPDLVTHDEVVAYITEHFASVDVTRAMGGTFFSVDPEKHWPNFATLVTTDEHDPEQNSDLASRGAYRLNIGVERESFERLIDPTKTYDYTATDVVIPHPTYAKQRWIAIVNPRRPTFDDVIMPLLDEGYQKVARTTRRG